MGIFPLKKGNAESIYSTLIDWLKKKKYVQCRKLSGMGFDCAATFAAKKSGVQAGLKKNAPHAIFIHCHCHRLQLAIVKLQLVLRGSSTSILHSPLCGSFSIAPQRDAKHYTHHSVEVLLSLPKEM